tara:strand:- start:230 stop:358 length:129 start_codon:yes stop_codon:yes gene_type:complete
MKKYSKQEQLRYYRKYFRYLEKVMKKLKSHIKELERTVFKQS